LKASRILLIVPVMAMVLIAIIATGQSAPQLINYQGRLNDNNTGLPLDGVTVDLTFRFYGVESGTTPLYLTVVQEDTVVTAGLYNVLIGSGTITAGDESTLADVFQKHSDVWMGVEVDTDGEMTPRSRISSAPYSLAVDLSAFYAAVVANPDFDGDGYKTSLLGGLDCNDGDSTINPDGQDLTYDGIDQNCNGQDGDEIGEIPNIYMFSSQSAYNGGLGGRGGADAICQNDINNYPHIPRDNVFGFLSISSNDEIQDMPSNYGVPLDRPVWGPTDLKIADNWADLLDGNIDQSLSSAEISSNLWWSGSNIYGALSGNCDGFANAAAEEGTIGVNFMTDNWIDGGPDSCMNTNVLLCISW